MKSYFTNRYILNAVLIICWLATAILGFNGFFKSHDLLTVSSINYQIGNGLTAILGAVAFTFPVIGLFVNVRIAKWLLITAVFVYTLLILFDLHRLTPYMIVYLGIFTSLILLKYDSSVLFTALLIIASGIYIFSGLHKLNAGFVTDIAPRLWFHSLPFSYNNSIGYSFAILETVAGLFLLIPLARKFASILLIVMHLIIIWKLGPWKLDWNYIVIPWNVMMIAVLIFLFRKSSFCKFKIGAARGLIITLGFFFWLLPAISQVTWIPENLSMMLYSGKSKSGYLIIEEKVDRFKSYDRTPENDKMLISLQQYSMEERGIAIHPEIEIYDEILENIKSKIPTADSIYYTNPKKLMEKL
ncbi:putative membrane protein YphA (DoxX/SURF4 family) [Nonlabens dokdonensis]|uniref:Uncharacterized protein n=2 Tax=Nonlabens dokdonensis TaxID=328515 RepID=L7WAL2_NONDD|nr:DoxX family protein [Nonlabens dokdonensis]AGC77169.1 hypothetical protein DDD_2042 [Nonlabens dokdonensis DSW-6]PZX41127.1 putative membrane protein YphA (DoxX/SURF4 family) [Nonlabens dokdonensis]